MVLFPAESRNIAKQTPPRARQLHATIITDPSAGVILPRTHRQEPPRVYFLQPPIAQLAGNDNQLGVELDPGTWFSLNRRSFFRLRLCNAPAAE